ncbi:MAG: putative molybdenum carrier protein [Balneolaceae bacterium]|nr:putative molybdenum carrier protein [Balneolaceae bacterium]
MSLRKIISGGQTGVDQAALQAAIDSGFEHGGWCPPGRICDSGEIPIHFKLKETPEERDKSALEIPRSQRTIWNVRDSDGLLVIEQDQRGKGSKAQRDLGTELTIESAKKLGKPFLIVYFNRKLILTQISNWISTNKIEVLNVAGPSERNCPGIYDRVYDLKMEILTNSV